MTKINLFSLTQF